MLTLLTAGGAVTGRFVALAGDAPSPERRYVPLYEAQAVRLGVQVQPAQQPPGTTTPAADGGPADDDPDAIEPDDGYDEDEEEREEDEEDEEDEDEEHDEEDEDLFAALVRLPAATRSCASRRRFEIRIRRLPGLTYRIATVRVNRRRVRVLRGGRITASIVLRNIRRGTFTIDVRVLTSAGTITGTRTYRACVPRRSRRGAARRRR